MSLFAAGGPLAYETSITNMPESGLIVLAIGAVILLCALLLPPNLAGRAPRHKGPASTPPWTGPVQGGLHLGDGRSVAPHRDAPAEAFDQEQVAQAQAARATVVRDDEQADDNQAHGEQPGTQAGEQAGAQAGEQAGAQAGEDPTGQE